MEPITYNFKAMNETWQDTDALDKKLEKQERDADDYWKEKDTI